MGESLSEYLILQRFSEFFLSFKIQNTSVFQPVYHGLLTNGPLSVCAFLCTLLVQFPPNSFLSLYFIHVTLLLCCTFFVLCSFHDSLFPMYSCKLHSFGVEIFPALFSYVTFLCYNLSVLPFLHITFFSCCSFSAQNSFHILLFPCCTFFVLHCFHVALFHNAFFSSYTFFHIVLFPCCTTVMMLVFFWTFFTQLFLRVALFSCTTVMSEVFSEQVFRRKLRSN